MGKKSTPPRDETEELHVDDSDETSPELQEANIQRGEERIEESEQQSIVQHGVNDSTVIVRVIQRGRGAVLIQWNEDKRSLRGWVPDVAIDSDQRVNTSELDKAIPYGIPFQDLLEDIIISKQQLIDELHRRNIWTEQDIINNPVEISRAITASVSMSVSKFQTAVREYVRGAQDNARS